MINSKLIYRLWLQICSEQKRQFLYILLLMVLVSFFEIVNIGAVLPFLTVLTKPEILFLNPQLKAIMMSFGCIEPEQCLLPITVAFALTAIIAGGMRVFLLWATTRFALNTCAQISSDIYLRTLCQPYEVHIARNSSEIVNGVLSQTNSVIYDTVLPLMFLISSAIIATAILSTLIFYDPTIAIVIFSAFGSIYLLVIVSTKRLMRSNGEVLARESTKMIQSVQEGLGGIRDILLDGSQNVYWKIYQDSNAPLRRVQASIAFIANCPRYIVEALGMVLISGLSFWFAKYNHGDVALTLPFLGVLALGGQRLLPIFQQAYSSLTLIKSGKNNLDAILTLLEQPVNKQSLIGSTKTLEFQMQLQLEGLAFKYPSQEKEVFSGINISVSKGSCIGIIGKSGSGKSTLLDILMGLLRPTKGCLKVDGKRLPATDMPAWQALIAHVPQSIYLADASIEENIAFGIPRHEIDQKRVRVVAKQAQLSSLIESWPDQYESSVGERGVKLSGGQRQRIGIARALYKNAQIIIFDEATSALDGETELEIIDAIEGLDKNLTLIIVAHRLSTLKNCSKIYQIADGSITEFDINTVKYK